MLVFLKAFSFVLTEFDTGNKWHYVSDNDTCASIFAEFGLTAAQFYSWNPATGSKCDSMGRKTEVCVGISGIFSCIAQDVLLVLTFDRSHAIPDHKHRNGNWNWSRISAISRTKWHCI
jgi:hypothetical protein